MPLPRRKLLWSPDKTLFEYGCCFEVSPRTTPNASKFIHSGCDVDFGTDNILLHGPFNFLPRLPLHPGSSFVGHGNWIALACASLNVTLPSLARSPGLTAAASTYRCVLPMDDVRTSMNVLQQLCL